MTTALAAALLAAGAHIPAVATSAEPAPRKPNGNKVDIASRRRKPKGRGKWGKSIRANTIEWSHPAFGSVTIELQQFAFMGEVYQEGPNTWQKIALRDNEPSEIKLDFNYSLNEDVKILYGCGKTLIDVSDPSKGYPGPYVAHVVWKEPFRRDGDRVPNIDKNEGPRDFQIILMNRKGFMVTLDVAVVVRKGAFWATVQEVFGCQIVRHPINDEMGGIDGYTSILYGDYGLTLVPVYNENCFPGSDPVASIDRSYPGRVEQLLELADSCGMFIPFEECEPSEWQPEWPGDVPAELAKRGFLKAVVMWFNLTIGWGFARLEDGTPCRIHFSKVENAAGENVANMGEFPVLQPGKGIFVKTKLQTDPSDGLQKLEATVIRPPYV